MFSVTNYSGFSAASGAHSATPPNTTGLAAWYDFSNSTSLTTSGSGISQVNDLSTNAFNATSSIVSTNTFYPTVKAAALNGLNMADFSGAASTRGKYLVSTGAIASGSHGLSVVMVALHANSTLGTNGIDVMLDTFPSLNSQNDCVLIALTSTNTYGMDVYDGGHKIAGTLALPDTGHVYTLTRSGSAGTLIERVDGGVVSSTFTAGVNDSGTASAIIIGNDVIGTGTPSSGNPWGGYIGEIRIFKAALSQTDYQKEEGYLAWKWGLQGNLASGHPYKNAPP